MTWDLEAIRARCECCACGTPLSETKTENVNLVATQYAASWKYPVTGNVLTKGSVDRAVGVACDACCKTGACKLTRVVQFEGDDVIYHAVETLEQAEPQYSPVPVEAAAAIAEQYDKTMVMIVANDQRHKRTHVTTYGASPVDKVMIADLADQFRRDYLAEPLTTYEDFRTIDQAKRARAIRALMNTVKELRGVFVQAGSHKFSECIAACDAALKIGADS